MNNELTSYRICEWWFCV